MNPTKVCVFCESWESGGIESFLNNILLHMNLQDMEVDIVTACLKESVFTAGLEAHGIHFCELSGRKRNLASNHCMFRELLRKRKYDVVHLNLFQGLALHYAHIAQQEGVPIRIAHSHNTALRKSPIRVAKLLLHRLGSALYTHAATDLWACSKDAATFLFPSHELENKGYTFIPNGVEISKFQFDQTLRTQTRKELGIDEHLVVGNVGRLTYQKNQSFALDVFAEIVKLHPNSTLLLVGEGEDRMRLEEKSLQLGIADRVIFHGVSKQVERLFWAMDLFIFPSQFEGLGIVAMEAQAAGLPVLCSDAVPREAHLTEGIHALALGDSSEHWAKTALAMAAVKAERSYGAKAVASAGFDVRDVVKKIEKRYKE